MGRYTQKGKKLKFFLKRKAKLEEMQDQISITNNAFRQLEDEREKNLNVKKREEIRSIIEKVRNKDFDIWQNQYNIVKLKKIK